MKESKHIFAFFNCNQQICGMLQLTNNFSILLVCLYFMLAAVEHHFCDSYMDENLKGQVQQRACAGYETLSGTENSSVPSCLALLTPQYEVKSVVLWMFVNIS